MIDIKQLRVGSQVYYNGEVKTIKPRHFYNLYASDYHNFQPIPITEEVLVKCGFERDGVLGDYLLRYSIGESDITRMISVDISGIVWACAIIDGSSVSSFRLCKVGSFHQLQNIIYDLSGKEVKI